MLCLLLWESSITGKQHKTTPELKRKIKRISCVYYNEIEALRKKSIKQGMIKRICNADFNSRAALWR